MTVNDLLLALAETRTDVERRKVLAAAPAKVREELAGLYSSRDAALAYHEMTTPPTDTLMRKLDGCVDNSARAALVKAATPKERKALAEDVWLRDASETDVARHYRDMVVTEEM